MTLSNHDTETVENYLARGGVIRDCGGFTRDTIPLLSSQRKPLPEWEARRKQREKAKAAPVRYYSKERLARMIGLGSGRAKTYPLIDQMVAAGLLPPPDVEFSNGNGLIHRWLCDKIDALEIIKQCKPKTLADIARKHA